MKTAYLIIAIGVFIVIAGFVFLLKKRGAKTTLSPLASVAFAFILTGILFGENRGLSYGLMLTGIVLALIDIIKKRGKQTPK